MAKEYYILIDGEKVPVSEEVYRAFKRPVWAEKKRRQREQENGTTPLSLDAFTKAGLNIPSDQALIDEIVEDKLLLDMLFEALATLTDDERNLIDALYFNEQTIREYARLNNTNHTNVIRRHKRIIEKLRTILKKYL
ncbi:hypothetical protein ACFPOH_16500 [Ureibacillus suwonensis]|uniref:Sigma-70 family RNA polymerase sigma factor n=1 Tax=Ureibacillus suwonensis TaxID=313007 RepID=A0ABW0REP9_9BACL